MAWSRVCKSLIFTKQNAKEEMHLECHGLAHGLTQAVCPTEEEHKPPAAHTGCSHGQVTSRVAMRVQACVSSACDTA